MIIIRRYLGFATCLLLTQAATVVQEPRKPCLFSDDDDYLDSNMNDGKCELTTLTGLSFTEDLDLQDSSIQHIADQVLVNLPHVTKVNLSNNVLTELPAFSGLANVREIDLQHNQLTVADFTRFHNNPKLESIDYGHNNVTKITPDDGVNITSLRLNNNDLRVVSDLCRLTQLESLDLSGNRQLQWPNFEFKCWPNMQTLVLADANLKSMNNDYQTAFGGMTKLEVLNIAKNDIVNICATNYPNLPALVELNISNNKLSSLNVTQLLEKFPKLKKISIWNNAWSCEYFDEKLQPQLAALAELTGVLEGSVCDPKNAMNGSEADSLSYCTIIDQDGPVQGAGFYAAIGGGVIVCFLAIVIICSCYICKK